MINKVFLVGNAGKDPVVKSFYNDNQVLEFSVATSEKWKKGDEWQEKTEWHQVKMFSKHADKIAERIKKGTTVAITGKITYRTYDDKDGNTKYITEIVADTIKAIGAKAASDSDNYSSSSSNSSNASSSTSSAADDDLPF